MEIWKDIVGYEKRYKVSNYGKIISLMYYSNIHKKYYEKETILKEKTNKNGYKFVSLSNGKRNSSKNYQVHKLVAQAFISNFNNCKEINHIDGNKSNNKVDNLEWCTRSENMLHSYKMKLRGKSALCNRNVLQLNDNEEIIKKWENISEIKKILNLDYSSIYQCCCKKRQHCNGYKWKFAEDLQRICRGFAEEAI